MNTEIMKWLKAAGIRAVKTFAQTGRRDGWRDGRGLDGCAERKRGSCAGLAADERGGSAGAEKLKQAGASPLPFF